jgi:hypothetical protein
VRDHIIPSISSQGLAKMEHVAYWLKWFFTNVGYPLIILAVVLTLIGTIVAMVRDATDDKGSLQRLIGACLPVIVLIFFIFFDNGPLRQALLSVPIYLHFIAGAVIGIVLIEAGRALWNTTSDAGASIFILFLSLMGVFILYSFMQGFLGTLNYFLVSAIVMGGLDFMVRD